MSFGDLVTAQQSLAGYLTTYTSALGLQWTAVVDMANLLQTDDLFRGTEGEANPDVPSLEELENMMGTIAEEIRTRRPNAVAAPQIVLEGIQLLSPTEEN